MGFDPGLDITIIPENIYNVIIVRCVIDLIHGYMCAFLGGTSINHIFVVCKKIAIFDRILFLLWLAKILLPSSSFTKNPARVRVAL